MNEELKTFNDQAREHKGITRDSRNPGDLN